MNSVSIIVPVFNAADTIPECLQALLAQEVDEEFEIICVDNNSTDDGIDVIPRSPLIKVLNEPRQGAYAARNTGVVAANGNVLLFSDPDCVAEPGWIAGHLRVLKRDDTAISLGRVRHGGGGRMMHLLSEYDHARQLTVIRSRAGRHYFGYTNNLGVTAEAWKRLGPFELRQRGADTILVQKALREFGPNAIRYVPRAVVRHLEVDAVSAYLGKMFLYGRSSRLFRDLASPEPPGWRIRLRSIELALSHSRASTMERLGLLSSLAAGVLAWHFGYRVGRRLHGDDARSARVDAAD